MCPLTWHVPSCRVGDRVLVAERDLPSLMLSPSDTDAVWPLISAVLCPSAPLAALWGQSRGWAGSVTSRGGSLLPQGMSETFETLHNLVHKGVKVVMDIPYELWNETSAEVADLKKQVHARRGQPAAAVQAGGGSAGAGRTQHAAPTPRVLGARLSSLR